MLFYAALLNQAMGFYSVSLLALGSICVQRSFGIAAWSDSKADGVYEWDFGALRGCPKGIAWHWRASTDRPP